MLTKTVKSGNYSVKFRPTNKRQPCPICEDTKGKCRTTEGNLILCTTYHESIPGWHFIGKASNDFWNKFVPEGDRPEPRPAKGFKEPEPQKRIITAEKWDSTYRTILSQIPLTDRHIQDFIRRGLTSSEIESLSAVARSTVGGYIIPFPDVYGRYVGAQKRLDEPGDGGRYRWHYPDYSWYLGHGQFIGAKGEPEKPLAVWGTGSPWIIEGTGIKPLVASVRHGITAIGAACGQHYLSPKTLADSLKQLGNPTSIVFCPDSGDVVNAQVMPRIRNNVALLESMGLKVKIAWWGQFTKDDADIDEIPNLDKVQYLTPDEFWELEIPINTPKSFIDWVRETAMKSANSFREMVWGSKKVDLPNKITLGNGDPVPSRKDYPDPPQIEYRKGTNIAELIAKLKAAGWESAIDTSFTGEGKSHRAGELHFNGTTWYLDTNHNNPSVETIRDGYANLWPRHNGLWEENGVLTRKPIQQQEPSIPGNCPSADLFPILSAKNYAVEGKENPICGVCPHKGHCGIDLFKSQRRQALASPRIRADIHSLPIPTEWNYSGDTAIIEEATTIARASLQRSQSTTPELLMLLNKIKRGNADVYRSIEPLGDKLIELLESQKPRYGLGHEDIVQHLPAIPDINLEAITQALKPELKLDMADSAKGVSRTYFEQQAIEENKASLENLPSNALIPLLEFMIDGKGSLSMEKDTLTVTRPDERKRTTIQSFGFRLFLDATGNTEAIEAGFGLPKNSIIKIAQEMPCLKNLTVYQTNMSGLKSKQRSESANERVEAYVDHLRHLHPDLKVLGRKGEKGIDGWWGNHNRGTNKFKAEKYLLSIGLFYLHVGAIQSEYRSFFGTLEGFQEYYTKLVQDEIIQWIGRQRVQHFPEVQFHLDMLATWEGIDLKFLNDRFGIKVVERQAVMVCTEAGDTGEKIKFKIFNIARSAGAVTQEALASALNISQQAFSKHVQAIYGNWSSLKQKIQLFLSSNKGKVVLPGSDEPSYEAVYTLASFIESLGLGNYSEFDELWDDLPPHHQSFYLGNLLGLLQSVS